MFGKALRILVGYAAACLVAGVVKVLFVLTPAQLSELPSDVAADRIANGAVWALAVATHSAIFAAPVALIAIAVGEWRELRGWLFYVLAAIAIMMVGYVSQYVSEGTSEPSIANNYAFTAFLTAGFFAGYAYWMIAGRLAGGDRSSHRFLGGDIAGSSARR